MYSEHVFVPMQPDEPEGVPFCCVCGGVANDLYHLKPVPAHVIKGRTWQGLKKVGKTVPAFPTGLSIGAMDKLYDVADGGALPREESEKLLRVIAELTEQLSAQKVRTEEEVTGRKFKEKV